MYLAALLIKKGWLFMKNKSIADLKIKVINAIDDIDASKLTFSELKTLVDMIAIIGNVNDKPFDFMDAFTKIFTTGFNPKPTTLSDLKEDE